MINYKVKKKKLTHMDGSFAIRSVTSLQNRLIIPSLCLCFSDGVVGENVYDGKQPFVVNLKNEYKAILPELPSEVSLTYLFLAFFLDGLFL